MKLYVLPLLSKVLPNSTSTLPLYYLHVQKLPSSNPPKITIQSRLLNKAASSWSELNTTKPGTINSLKKRIYNIGDGLMDKIAFEEFTLKSIHVDEAPALWSDLTKFSNQDGQKWKEEGRKPLERVELLFPSSILKSPALKADLIKSFEKSIPSHYNSMRNYLLLSPLMIPFAIVPLIPNLPLFYTLYRAYSNYKAYKASQYLTSLFSTSQIAFIPSPFLDSLYPPPPSSPSTDNQVLLSETKIPSLISKFNLSTEDEKSFSRAILQARLRAKKAEIVQKGGDGEKVDRKQTVDALKKEE